MFIPYRVSSASINIFEHFQQKKDVNINYFFKSAHAEYEIVLSLNFRIAQNLKEI